MNSTKNFLTKENIQPKKEIIENLKSFARSYKTEFSKSLNKNIGYITN
tara:strand:+ start:157 stop:300 length:144 start_codon:yes stop_codon:yes gene_type:complete